MKFTSWLGNLRSAWFFGRSGVKSKKARRARDRRVRPVLEGLEGRLAPVVGAFAPGPLAADDFSGVVRIMTSNALETKAGSGTVLATGRHILTAAHLVDRAFKIEVEFNFGTPMEVDYTPSKVIINPGFNSATGANDIAILELPELAPANITRFDIFRDTTELDAGGVFTIVGYGEKGTGTTGAQDETDGTRRLGFNTFDATGEALTANGISEPAKTLFYDFDSGQPQDDSLGKLGFPGLGLGPGEAMSTSGDSGGPDLRDGKIAGVISALVDIDANGVPLLGQTAKFGAIGCATRVSSFQAWIDSQTLQQPYQLVVNMANQPYVDGVPDQITVQAVNSPLEIWVNGALLYADTTGKITGVTIRDPSDDDTFRIDGSVDIPVNIVGSGDDHLIFDDSSQDPFRVNDYTLTANPQRSADQPDGTVSRIAHSPPGPFVITYGILQVSYQGVGQVIVRTGPGTNGVNVASTADGLYVTIEANGTNSVTVGAGTINAIESTVTIDGLRGFVAMTLDDHDNDWSETTAYSITAERVTRENTYFDGSRLASQTATVNYRGIEDLEITGGDTRNTFDVHSLFYTRLTITGGDRKDTIHVGDELDLVDAELTIRAGAGAADELTLDDSRDADTATHSSSPVYTITDATVSRLNDTVDRSENSPITVTYSYRTVVHYSGVETLTVQGGSGGNFFHVPSTGLNCTTNLRGGAGGDSYILGDPGNLLSGLQGPVSVQGDGGTLVLDDRANRDISPEKAALFLTDAIITRPSYLITDTSVVRIDDALVYNPLTASWFPRTDTTRVSYSNVTSLELRGGQSPNVFTVQSTHAGIPVTIDMGSGTNTVQVTPDSQDLSNLKGDLTLKAGAGGQTIVFLHDRNNPGVPGSPVKDFYRIRAGGPVHRRPGQRQSEQRCGPHSRRRRQRRLRHRGHPGRHRRHHHPRPRPQHLQRRGPRPAPRRPHPQPGRNGHPPGRQRQLRRRHLHRHRHDGAGQRPAAD
jgi:hypothetical protein